MKNHFLLPIALLLTSCSSGEITAEKTGHFAETINAKNFYKGNLHTHTTESDGNVSPAAAIGWYKKHGYSFVAITDHDKLTIDHKQDSADFITLNGVEISSVAAGKRPVHANAICGQTAIKGVRAENTVHESANAMIANSRKDGAVTMVNHPNFGWAFTTADLLKTEGFEILEIASGHHLINESGDATHSSEEELWDIYMTQNHRIYGAAIDDTHNYTKLSDDEANPGRAWIQAWAPELTQAGICNALRLGHFYSARGTKLNALVVTPRMLELSVENWQPSTDYVDFIGRGGQLLARTTDNPARYALRGGEGYVRAHVHQGEPPKEKLFMKRDAWTQAYFIKND